MRLFNGLWLIRTLYFAPFTIYSLSKLWVPCQKPTFDLLKVKVLDLIQIDVNLSIALAICASNGISRIEIRSFVWTIHIIVCEKISMFKILPEITWGKFQNIFWLWGPLTPKPLNRMNPKSVPDNYIYSHTWLQNFILIAQPLRWDMWCTRHSPIWEEEK